MKSATIVPPSKPVRIATSGVSVNGDLTLPENASGIIVFVHGSGSSRFSQRNRAVADVLVRARPPLFCWTC